MQTLQWDRAGQDDCGHFTIANGQALVFFREKKNVSFFHMKARCE